MKTTKSILHLWVFVTLLLLNVQVLAQDWFPTGSVPDKYDMGGDPTVMHGSENPAFIRSNTTNIDGFGTWATAIDAAPYRGEGITLRAYVQATDVVAWSGLWVRVDGQSESLTFDNMAYRPIQGSTEWQEYQITLDVPDESVEIFFGLLLAGEGSLLFDGLTIESASRTWERQQLPDDISALCIDAVNDQAVWVGAAEGKALRTIDGGVNWETLSIPDAAGVNINTIWAIDANIAYCSAQSFDPMQNDARIYKAQDGGTSWMLQYQNTEVGAFFNSIAFWDADRGIAVSDPVNGSFLILTTIDGGLTWEQVDSNRIPAPLAGELAGFGDVGGTTVAVSGDQHVWFGTSYVEPSGDPIRIFRSANGGQAWDAVETPLDTSRLFRGISSIQFQDSIRGFAGSYHDGIGNALLRTVDGGMTWTLVDSFPAINPSTISFVPDATNTSIFIASLQGSVFSNDNTATWQQLSTEPCTGLTFSDPNSGWAIRTFDGGVVKFVPRMTTALEDHSTTAQGYVLGQNYPNPFTKSTTATLTIPETSLVNLVVFDNKGRQVRSVFEATLPVGTHEASINLGDLPNGIYFLQMQAGLIQKSVKMFHLNK